MQAITDIPAFVGKIVAFLDVPDSVASAVSLESARSYAETAHNAGIDTLVFRRGNGTEPTKSYDELCAERDVVHGAGCGYLPYMYCYGPSVSWEQIREECRILAMLGSVNGMVVADLEQEYCHEIPAGHYFSQLMRPVPCKLALTTFADPITTGFPVDAIAPCVDVWVPQEYDNFLAFCDNQRIAMTHCFPALDLNGNQFGQNDTDTIIHHIGKAGSIWLWSYRETIVRADVIRTLKTSE